MSVKALFVFKTEFPDGSSPRVLLAFDGRKQKELVGGVNGGYLHIDLGAYGIDELQRMVDLLQSSSSLMESAFSGVMHLKQHGSIFGIPMQLSTRTESA